MSEVSLTISKEIVTPIVEAKVKALVMESFGGAEVIIDKILNSIINQRVDINGKVSSYSSENKYSYIDAILTEQIRIASQEAIKEVMSNNASVIKESLIKQLQSKKGSELAAKALLNCLNGTFEKSWTSQIKIELQPYNND